MMSQPGNKKKRRTHFYLSLEECFIISCWSKHSHLGSTAAPWPGKLGHDAQSASMHRQPRCTEMLIEQNEKEQCKAVHLYNIMLGYVVSGRAEQHSSHIYDILSINYRKRSAHIKTNRYA